MAIPTNGLRDGDTRWGQRRSRMGSVVRRRLPASVQLAFVLWLTAIGAGVFETILVLVQALNGTAPEENLALGVAVRLVIFAVMTAVIFQLRRGRNWARIVLTIAL